MLITIQLTVHEKTVLVGALSAAIEQFTDALRICPNDPDAPNVAAVSNVMQSIYKKLEAADTD